MTPVINTFIYICVRFNSASLSARYKRIYKNVILYCSVFPRFSTFRHNLRPNRSPCHHHHHHLSFNRPPYIQGVPHSRYLPCYYRVNEILFFFYFYKRPWAKANQIAYCCLQNCLCPGMVV